MSSNRAERFKPMDGGWGWVVVLGAHVSIGFSYTTPKILSILFTEIQEDLGSSASEVALISSIMLASMYGGGPLGSVLVNRFGSRPVVIIGGLMCGISMAIASLGNSIIFLYLCIGIIGGCGLGFNLNASLTMISKYFLKKRPLANGLAMAGSPVFLFAFSPLTQYFQLNFGWRGSLLIIGGMILNCCVAGALMKPVKMPPKPPSSSPEVEVELQANGSNAQPKPSRKQTFLKTVDFTLFKDRLFISYLIGSVLFLFGAYSPIVFLSPYAISNGVEEYSASYLLSILGFVDMLARPGTGLVANTKWIRPKIQYFFSLAMILSGVSHLLCPLMKSYVLLVVYVVLYGVSFGMVFALIFECLMNLVGNERFPSAVGMVTVIECIPMLLGPPTAGFILDVTGDYNYLFLMCGSVVTTGGVFLFVANIVNDHLLKKKGMAKERSDPRNCQKEGQDGEETSKFAEQTEPEAEKEIETTCPEKAEASIQSNGSISA